MRGLGPARCTPGTASLDVLVHGRDMAMATGQDHTLDPMEARRQVIEHQLTAFRSVGALGPEVAIPPDASAQTGYLALLSRNG